MTEAIAVASLRDNGLEGDEAMARLVEACLYISRDGNTDTDMTRLSRAMNEACVILDDGDLIGYSRESGTFLLLHR